MISGIVPRPIGFVSTVSADGKSTNLAPFSYTQMVNHDPPVIVIGFSGGSAQPKNTLKNILETKECTVNMINEDMVEYILSSACLTSGLPISALLTPPMVSRSGH